MAEQNSTKKAARRRLHRNLKRTQSSIKHQNTGSDVEMKVDKEKKKMLWSHITSYNILERIKLSLLCTIENELGLGSFFIPFI